MNPDLEALQRGAEPRGGPCGHRSHPKVGVLVSAFVSALVQRALRLLRRPSSPTAGGISTVGQPLGVPSPASGLTSNGGGSESVDFHQWPVERRLSGTGIESRTSPTAPWWRRGGFGFRPERPETPSVSRFDGNRPGSTNLGSTPAGGLPAVCIVGDPPPPLLLAPFTLNDFAPFANLVGRRFAGRHLRHQYATTVAGPTISPCGSRDDANDGAPLEV